jgi:hypothetical protein
VETLPLTATDEEIFAFACRWTQLLVNEDYQAAFDMLCYVPRSHPYNQPGESHFSNASEMKACIMNYGADKPIAGEPIYKVTPMETADNGSWPMDPQWQRKLIRYEGQLGRLDWFLPLNGEWSDLQASLDMVEHDGRLAVVLTALRIP